MRYLQVRIFLISRVLLFAKDYALRALTGWLSGTINQKFWLVSMP